MDNLEELKDDREIFEIDNEMHVTIREYGDKRPFVRWVYCPICGKNIKEVT